MSFSTMFIIKNIIKFIIFSPILNCIGMEKPIKDPINFLPRFENHPKFKLIPSLKAQILLHIARSGNHEIKILPLNLIETITLLKEAILSDKKRKIFGNIVGEKVVVRNDNSLLQALLMLTNYRKLFHKLDELLIYTAQYNALDCLQTLQSFGANLNSEIQLLTNAASHGHLEFITYLLSPRSTFEVTDENLMAAAGAIETLTLVDPKNKHLMLNLLKQARKELNAKRKCVYK